MESNKEKRMSFIGHLEELRHRLIVCIIAIAIGCALAAYYTVKIFTIVMRPLIMALGPGQKMIYTAPTEAFVCYMKTAILAGIIFAMPVILWEMWCFIVPGLYDKEKRFLIPLVFTSFIFFIGGVLFGYFVMLPFAFKYLLSFGSDLIQPLPSMTQAFNMAFMLLLAFGLVFEFPLVITGIARLGLVTPAFLAKNRKYAILLCFIAAAIITPTPDAVNQCLMAFPLCILYEVGILGARIFGKKKKEA